MAGRSDIRAGRAFVELSLKNANFTKGLKAASKQLKDFGRGVQVAGARITAAGTAMFAGFFLAAKKFADFGSELKDLSTRTGIGATALAELGYAAEQTGADMGDVEISLKKMGQFLGLAARGSKEARAQLGRMGLSFAALSKMKPEDQFETIGAALMKLPEGFKRTSAAVMIFGRSGTMLIPMLAELAELRKEARDLGLAPSQEDVNLADKLGDAFHRMARAAGAVMFQIGAALAPALIDASKVMVRIIVNANKWVKANKELVVTIAKFSLALIAAGVFITAAGTGIIFLGMVMAALASASAAVVPLLWAIAGGLAGWLFALNGLFDSFAPFLATARQTFQGIYNAMIAADIGLAAQIGWAGVMLAYAQGTKWVMDKWDSFTTWILDMWDITSTGIASVAINMWAKIKDIYATGKWAVMGIIIDMAKQVTVVLDSLPAAVQAAMGWKKGTAITYSLLNVANDAMRKGAHRENEADREGQQGALRGDLARRIGKRDTARKGRGQDRQADVDAAQRRLDELTAKAASAAERARAQDELDRAKAAAAGGDGSGEAASQIFQTFSASALAAAGAGTGGSPIDRVGRTLQEIRDEARKNYQEERQARRELWRQLHTRG